MKKSEISYEYEITDRYIKVQMWFRNGFGFIMSGQGKLNIAVQYIGLKYFLWLLLYY